MKKTNIILLIALFSMMLFGNISAPPPCIQGDIAGESILQNIAVSNEILCIDFNRFKELSLAFVEAKYTLETDSEKASIPLIFVAKNLANDHYSILLDGIQIVGKSIHLDTLPEAWDIPEGVLPLRINWDREAGPDTFNKDLIQFEIPLTKGKHTLSVSYQTKLSKDIVSGTPTASYEFFYILRPTHQWKEFRNVTIKVKPQKDWEISSNLPFDKENTFTCPDIYQLKDNYFFVRTQPKTKFATNMGTFLQILFSLLGICLIILCQVFLFKKARKFIPFSTFLLSIVATFALLYIIQLPSDVYAYYLGGDFEYKAFNRIYYGLAFGVPFFWAGILIGIIILNLIIKMALKRMNLLPSKQ